MLKKTKQKTLKNSLYNNIHLPTKHYDPTLLSQFWWPVSKGAEENFMARPPCTILFDPVLMCYISSPCGMMQMST